MVFVVLNSLKGEDEPLLGLHLDLVGDVLLLWEELFEVVDVSALII